MSAILDSALDPQRMQDVRTWDRITERAACLPNTAFVKLDGVEMLAEYEYEAPTAARPDEPSFPGSCQVLRLMVNGAWIDAGYFGDAAHALMAEQIFESKQ